MSRSRVFIILALVAALALAACPAPVAAKRELLELADSNDPETAMRARALAEALVGRDGPDGRKFIPCWLLLKWGIIEHCECPPPEPFTCGPSNPLTAQQVDECCPKLNCAEAFEIYKNGRDAGDPSCPAVCTNPLDLTPTERVDCCAPPPIPPTCSESYADYLKGRAAGNPDCPPIDCQKDLTPAEQASCPCDCPNPPDCTCEDLSPAERDKCQDPRPPCPSHDGGHGDKDGIVCIPDSICRTAKYACEEDTICNEWGQCPPSAPVPRDADFVCRPSAGECDQEELCDGINLKCPEDAFLPAGTDCVDINGDDSMCLGGKPEKAADPYEGAYSAGPQGTYREPKSKYPKGRRLAGATMGAAEPEFAVAEDSARKYKYNPRLCPLSSFSDDDDGKGKGKKGL